MKGLACLFFVLLSLASPARTQTILQEIRQGLDTPVGEAYLSQRLGDFTLFFHPVDQAYAAHVAAVIHGAQSRLQQELSLSSMRGSQVVVAWDPSHFYRLAGSGTPHWAGAVANVEARRIVLKSPRWGDAEPDAGATIRHEMTHLAVGRITRGKRIPVWLEEGLAVHLSGLPYHAHMQEGGTSLARAMATGSLLSLDELESLHGFSSLNADLAYQEAESAVRFLLERHGRVALMHTLTQVGRGKEFSSAFDAATGGAFFRFEMEWRAWLKKQRGLYFLMDFSSWVWGGILVLAALVWWMRRRRAKRILAQWSREEQDDEQDEEPFLD